MNRKARRIAEKKARQKKKRGRKSLSKEEIRAHQSLGGHIGVIRRIAKRCGLNPDDIIYGRAVGGEKRWFPGKLLLERGHELPMLSPEQQRELDWRREEAEWARTIREVAEYDGRSEQEVADEVMAVADAKIESDLKEILEA